MIIITNPAGGGGGTVGGALEVTQQLVKTAVDSISTYGSKESTQALIRASTQSIDSKVATELTLGQLLAGVAKENTLDIIRNTLGVLSNNYLFYDVYKSKTIAVKPCTTGQTQSVDCVSGGYDTVTGTFVHDLTKWGGLLDNEKVQVADVYGKFSSYLSATNNAPHNVTTMFTGFIITPFVT